MRDISNELFVFTTPDVDRRSTIHADEIYA